MFDIISRKLSVILALFGKYENLNSEFDIMVNELQQFNQNTEIIIVSDSIEWTYSPMYQMLPIRLNNVKLLVLDKESHLPAVLFNKGLEEATGDYVLFSYLNGYKLSSIVDLFYQNKIWNDENVFCIRNINENILGIYPSNQNRYGFLQIDRFYMIDEIIAKTELLKKIHGFNPSPLLQRDFDREISLRLAKDNDFTELGVVDRKILSFNNYPFKKIIHYNKDLINRYIIRNSRLAFQDESYEMTNQNFANDLNVEEAYLFYKATGIKAEQNLKYNKKYKIMVLGGFWEYHHNQICFFNYFENLAGQGFCTYNTAFEYSITEYELDTYDLVIFTRCRSDNAVKLIQYCNKHNIATIYLIDDNWITIAKDLPKLGSFFVKGNPNYDNFIEAIKNCKSTWLFNDYLLEDIKPYARHITKFSISVDPNLFHVNNNRNNDIIKIGFSGSLRFDNIAFKALSRVANERKNIIIVLVGILSDDQRKLFENSIIEEAGFSSYGVYAKNISKLQPDLLIAPLSSRTRTEKSKCYNKYVESAIIKAACLFSNTEPYTLVVKDQINGYFVDDETEEGWYKKLKNIVDDINTLRIVQNNAYNDVIENYTVGAVLGKFAENIEIIIEKEL